MEHFSGSRKNLFSFKQISQFGEPFGSSGLSYEQLSPRSGFNIECYGSEDVLHCTFDFL
jgi:hypothetical protein